MNSFSLIPVQTVACSEQFLGRMLRRPQALLWPDNEQELGAIREQCCQTLSSLSHTFLDLAIFTTLLLDKNRYGKIIDTDNLLDLLPDLPFVQSEIIRMLNGKWAAAPVAGVVSGGDTAVITWYIIGCSIEEYGFSFDHQWPYWAEEVMADNARQAVKDAFTAVCPKRDKNKKLFVFPLCNPVDAPPLQGRSLGLPIALAASSLMQNRISGFDFLATGDIDENGKILPVNQDSLAAKIIAAQNENCSLFLYPMANRLASAEPDKLHTRPVASLRQAKIWSDCFSLSMEQEVQRLDTALQDSYDFVRNIDGLRPEFLEWLHSTGAAADLIAEVCTTAELCTILADKLGKILKTSAGDYHFPRLIANLITSQELIDRMGAANKVAAFSWCLSQLALANHCGDSQKEHFWADLGDKWAEEAKSHEDGRKLYPDFVNRRFGISDRHNSYHFNPNLPEEFSKLLAINEKQHQAACESGPCSNYALGSMYGTVGQNYAFCGEEYLEQAKSCFNKAKETFGSQDKHNCQREDSYLFFSLLGSEQENSAKQAMEYLLASFDLAEAEDIQFDQLDGFQYFALLRAINDIGEQLSPEIRDRLTRLFFARFADFDVQAHLETKNIHPWQLCCYNLGLLALRENKRDLALSVLQKSLKLCLSPDGGRTLKAMAFLPLAAMYQGELAAAGILEEKTAALLQIIKAGDTLDQRHFQPLFEQETWQDVLREIRDRTALYFPFNYR